MQRNLIDQLWELDKEESHACMTITPIKEGDKRYYHIREEIVIHPYPNPFGYGGEWGNGFAETEVEVLGRISFFRNQLKVWQTRGLERIEVKRMSEVARSEHDTREQREATEAVKRFNAKPTQRVSQPSLL